MLFIAMAVLETGTGIALIASPPIVTWLLLGSPQDTPAAILIARLAGLALLCLGMVCWFASRDPKNNIVPGLMAAMLLYNMGAAMLLGYAGIGLGLSGVGLWPALLVHIGLAIGCIAALKPAVSTHS